MFVTLAGHGPDRRAAFEDAVPQIPEIIQAQRLFGDPDFLLHVVRRIWRRIRKLYDYSLSTLPSVRLTSTLVMRNVVQNRALPI